MPGIGGWSFTRSNAGGVEITSLPRAACPRGLSTTPHPEEVAAHRRWCRCARPPPMG